MLPNATFTITAGADKFTFTFDASESSDTDGTVETWGWAFGDGGTAYGETVAHVYAEYGTYIVTLTITDNEGGEDSYTVTVVIESEAPIALFFAHPYNVQTGSQVTFNGTASHDVDGHITNATWNFGDGMTLSGWWADVTIVNHVYNAVGLYMVTLTVTDDSGLADAVSHEVRVRP